jgi:hypothetical protein
LGLRRGLFEWIIELFFFSAFRLLQSFYERTLSVSMQEGGLNESTVNQHIENVSHLELRVVGSSPQLWRISLDRSGLLSFMFRLPSMPVFGIDTLALGTSRTTVCSKSGKARGRDLVKSKSCVTIEMDYTTVGISSWASTPIHSRPARSGDVASVSSNMTSPAN